MEEWLRSVVAFSEVMNEEAFYTILRETDTSCEMCGNCCTSTAGRCVYLTADKKCEIHHKKPTHCKEFPKIWKYEWVKGWHLATPENAVAMCGIVRKFWETAYRYIRGEL